MQRLLDASLTNSSASSYTHAWRLFINFAEKFDLPSDIPVKQHILAIYVTYLFSQDYAASTIASYLSAISYIHKLNNMYDPCASFIIQKLLVAARKLKPPQDVRLPITKAILHKISDALRYTVSSSFERVMFKSMFLLAFYAFLRIGEITSGQTISNKNLISFKQIFIEKDKITIKFLSYKHHMGKPFLLTIYSAHDSNYCPVKCLHDYVSIRGAQDGPLFCYVPDIPVSRIKFATVLKNSLGFSHHQFGKITCHSFRIGMASHCADIGMSDSKIRLLGRWKSDAFKSYIRPLHSC